MLKSNISDVYSQLYVCKEFRGVLVISMNFSEIAILNTYYRLSLCYEWN